MKCEVKRTSWQKGAPCDGATPAKLYYKCDPKIRPDNGWLMEIGSLDALLALIKAEGDVIVSLTSSYEGVEATIEIYDGYRE